MTTSDPKVRDRVALSRNHGLVDRDRCTEWGFNCRLDELHAAPLRVQLRHLDRWTEGRRELAKRYNDLLRPFVDVPDEGPGEYCVFQTYVVQADHRDDLQRHLQDHGVEVLFTIRPRFTASPRRRRSLLSPQDFPVTQRAASRILSLPLYPEITDTQQDLVAGLIADFFHQRTKP